MSIQNPNTAEGSSLSDILDDGGMPNSNTPPEIPENARIHGKIAEITDNSSDAYFAPVRQSNIPWKELPGIDSNVRVHVVRDKLEEKFELIGELGFSSFIKEYNGESEKVRYFNHGLCRLVSRSVNDTLMFKDSEGNFSIDIYEEICRNNPRYLANVVILKMYDRAQMTQFINRCEGKDGIINILSNYFQEMESKSVKLANILEDEALSIVCNHRWTSEYYKKMVAKLMDLKESEFSKMPIAFITLTTYQDGELRPDNFERENRVSIFEALDNVYDGRKNLCKNLRNVKNRSDEIDNFHYFWIVEPHKSGYPHIHMLIFGDVADWLRKPENRDRFRNLWANKWDIGNEFGIDFEFSMPQRGDDKHIENLVGYIMEYAGKSYEDRQDPIKSMDYGEWVLNSALFFTGSRSWGASKEVSNVMAAETSDKEDDEFSNKWKNLGGAMDADDIDSFDEIIDTYGHRNELFYVTNSGIEKTTIKDMVQNRSHFMDT